MEGPNLVHGNDLVHLRGQIDQVLRAAIKGITVNMVNLLIELGASIMTAAKESLPTPTEEVGNDLVEGDDLFLGICYMEEKEALLIKVREKGRVCRPSKGNIAEPAIMTIKEASEGPPHVRARAAAPSN